jgi:hypothetical protein
MSFDKYFLLGMILITWQKTVALPLCPTDPALFTNSSCLFAPEASAETTIIRGYHNGSEEPLQGFGGLPRLYSSTSVGRATDVASGKFTVIDLFELGPS